MSAALRTVLVIGATGDVGRGAVAACLARGWTVTAVARSQEGLEELAAAHESPRLRIVAASVGDESGARELAESTVRDAPLAVVNAISTPWGAVTVLETDYALAASYWQQYLGSHLAVIKAFVPLLGPESLLLGVGGGMADFVGAGQAVISMSQAAERMLYRTLALEVGTAGPAVRELLIVSKVRGHSNRLAAHPVWLSDTEIGARIADIIEDPFADDNRGPILKIHPQREEARP